MITPDPACEQAFSEWFANVILPPGDQVEDVAHEAWCAAWEAAEAAVSGRFWHQAQGIADAARADGRKLGAAGEREAILEFVRNRP